MKSLQIVFLASVLAGSADVRAGLNVVTTIPDLRSLVEEVGGSDVKVESIARGTQDPHFIEAKPSFMVKAHNADLFVAMGLELEVGWVPSILAGARNPKVAIGSKGYLELGPRLNPLEVARGAVSRADGDVHPDGNPHFNLDPLRMGDAALLVAERLGELDAAHAAQFMTRAKGFQDRMKVKTKEWQGRITKAGIKKVVTYHKTLTYFLDRFGIEAVAQLEPKPGVPPTSGHIIEVIETMKSKGVKWVLIENFFDPTVARKIQSAIPEVKAKTIPVLVDGEPGVTKIDDLFERIVRILEGN